MPVKRYKLAMPWSTQKIREARKAFKAMPREKRIDLMVKAGVMTEGQAQRAKKKPAETQD